MVYLELCQSTLLRKMGKLDNRHILEIVYEKEDIETEQRKVLYLNYSVH